MCTIEGLDGRGHGNPSSPVDHTSANTTTSKGPCCPHSEVQAKVQELEEEVQRLRLANNDPHATGEHKVKEWQQLRDQTSRVDEGIRGILSSRVQQQAREIKQLRDVGQFWLGLEQLRHQKITQFFDGNLPADDIVFQLAEKGPPES